MEIYLTETSAIGAICLGRSGGGSNIHAKSNVVAVLRCRRTLVTVQAQSRPRSDEEPLPGGHGHHKLTCRISSEVCKTRVSAIKPAESAPWEWNEKESLYILLL